MAYGRLGRSYRGWPGSRSLGYAIGHASDALRLFRVDACPDKRGKGAASALNVAGKQPVKTEPDIGCQLMPGLSGDHVAVGLRGRMEKLP